LSQERHLPRMGWPPLPRENTRPNRLVTFLSDEELELLRREADGAGLSLSATAHRLLRRSLGPCVEPEREP
jgi:hypothetical protein